MGNQCFVYRTTNIESYERFLEIRSCNYPDIDFFFVIDTSVYSGELPDDDGVIGINGDEIWDMWNGKLWDKKYKTNTQFYILNFYKEHPNYDYYWLYEDDIYMPNGDYQEFFREASSVECDFLHTTRINDYSKDGYKSLIYRTVDKSLYEKYKYCTWIQMFRLTPLACETLIENFNKSDRAHAELAFPSIIMNNCLSEITINESDIIRYRFIINNRRLPDKLLNAEYRNVFYHPMKTK